MKNLREARRAKGLTMKQLGQLLGVTESAISFYENGKRQPSFELTGQMASILGVTVSYLLGEQEQAPPAIEEELDTALVGMLVDLTPEELQRAKDFIAGMKAGRSRNT